MSSPTRNDFDQAATSATSSTDERRLTVRDDSLASARWRTDLNRDVAERDAEWETRRQEMLERAVTGFSGWAELKRTMDELSRRLKELEPLIPWARAVFVRKRYELSHDFVLGAFTILVLVTEEEC